MLDFDPSLPSAPTPLARVVAEAFRLAERAGHSREPNPKLLAVIDEAMRHGLLAGRRRPIPRQPSKWLD